jgi:hypothetical protein
MFTNKKDCRIILIVGSENFLSVQGTNSRFAAHITIQHWFAFPFSQVVYINCEQWNEQQCPEFEYLGEYLKALQRPLRQEPRPFGKNLDF